MPDITITLTVKSAKVQDFRAGFLKQIPVPLDENEDPIMSEIEWLKTVIIDNVKSQYRAGKEQLAIEQATTVVDEEIIQ